MCYVWATCLTLTIQGQTVKNSVCIEVRVKPNQPEFKIKCSSSRIDVELQNKADKNQANIELIKMFTKILKKPVKFVSGRKSKNKVIKIESMTEEQVFEVLGAIKN